MFTQLSRSPFLMIGAKALPKGALIETQVIAHTGQYATTDLEMEENNVCAAPIYQTGLFYCVFYLFINTDGYSMTGEYKAGSSSTVEWQRSRFAEIEAFSIILTVKGI